MAELKMHLTPNKNTISAGSTCGTQFSTKSSRYLSQKSTPKRPLLLSPPPITELENLWAQYSIPNRHRTLFRKKINEFEPKASLVFIRREISELKTNTSSVQRIVEKIENRENLLRKLKEFSKAIDESSGSFPDDLMLSGRLIGKYRAVTLETVENIAAWYQSFRLKRSDFEYNGQPYLLKCKTDTNFLCSSKLSQYFTFKRDDPFLMTPLKFNPTIIKNKKYKEQLLEPLGIEQVYRIRAAIKHLQLSSPPNRRKRRTKRKCNNEAKDSSGDSYFFYHQEDERTKIISEMLWEEVLECFINCEDIARHSYNEISHAALSLHSHSILDKYLVEMLAKMLPEIQEESQIEIRTQEYFDLKSQFVEELIQQEIHRISVKYSQKSIATEITEEWLGSFTFRQMIENAIHEEFDTRREAVFVVYDSLVDSFLSSDWMEELVEGILVQIHLDRSREMLPISVQKKLTLQEIDAVNERLAEDFYFDMLLTFVGGYWTSALTKATVDEHKGIDEPPLEELFVLEDPEFDLDELKKKISISKRLSVFKFKIY